MGVRKNYIVNFISVVLLYLVFYYFQSSGMLNNYYMSVLLLIGINIIVASSINLAVGYLGQLVLGHAGFMAVGAYTAAIFAKTANLPPMAELLGGLALALLLCGVISVLVGIPALRLKGDYLAIVTLGTGEVIRVAILNMKITGGAVGLTGIPKYVDFTVVYIAVVLCMTFLYLFVNSRHGRAILSIKEDEIAAESSGVPTTFYKVYGFMISAMIAGGGGALLAFYQRVLNPNKFTLMYSMEFFIIVVIGGMGSFTGTIVTAVFLAILNQFLYEFEQIRLLVYAAFLAAVMIFRPTGIFGTKEFSLTKFLDKIMGRGDKK